ncbi:MAG TPA: redoxin domain-containing protein [Bacteroidetes bacterium]|nr:redoxin domain-containing protein [Bacteroidota bacterium]
MRRWWVWTLAVVLLLALPVSVLATYSVGDTVRDFSLKDLRGTSVRLQSYRNKVILLNFFATW